MALTARQARFVEEFLVDLNATAAARRAGYSEHTARQIAAENLSKPVIQEAIAAAQQRRAVKTELTAAEVIDGLRKEAALTGEGSSHGARVTAWSWLGRHLAMFTDKYEHAFPDEDVDRALEEELQGLSARRASQGDGTAEAPGRPGEPLRNGHADGG
jgi:phage terminase small subunit